MVYSVSAGFFNTEYSVPRSSDRVARLPSRRQEIGQVARKLEHCSRSGSPSVGRPPVPNRRVPTGHLEGRLLESR